MKNMQFHIKISFIFKFRKIVCLSYLPFSINNIDILALNFTSLIQHRVQLFVCNLSINGADKNMYVKRNIYRFEWSHYIYVYHILLRVSRLLSCNDSLYKKISCVFAIKNFINNCL